MKEKLLKLFVGLYSLPPNWDNISQDKQKEGDSKIYIGDLYSTIVDLYKICVQINNYHDIPEIPELEKLKPSNYLQIIKKMKQLLIKYLPDVYRTNDIAEYVANVNMECNGKMPFLQLARMCSKLSMDASSLEKESKHMERIIALLKKKEQYQDRPLKLIENSSHGANAGYVVTIDKNKFYIKTFSEDAGGSRGKQIDICELFAYKVLELLKFGPETDCLLEAFSSSKGSSAQGNYIITKDIATIEDGETNVEKRRFLLDGNIENLPVYKQAMQNKKFKVELFALVSINSILRLYDTFADNVGNYGIVETLMKNGETMYEPKLIDHLPYSNNAEINGNYSPGERLQEKLSFFQDSDVKKSCLKNIVDNKFSSNEVNEEVKDMVVNGKGEINMISAISEARKYVSDLLKEYEMCFADDASKRLELYIRKALYNFKIFSENYGKKMMANSSLSRI